VKQVEQMINALREQNMVTGTLLNKLGVAPGGERVSAGKQVD